MVFHLSAPTPAILANLLEVQLISPASVKNVDKKPVGTGPFMFVEWVTGDHIKVAKNPDYFKKGEPLLDAIVFKTIPDTQVRLTNLRTNAVQMDDGLGAEDVKSVSGYSSARVIQSKPILGYEMLQINTKRAPFSDKRVRQALAWAFDRNAYVKSFWAGLARPGDNPFVKEMKEYLPGSDSRYGFDLDKTAALLAAAGYSKSKPLQIEILNPAGYSDFSTRSRCSISRTSGSSAYQVKVTDLELSAWIDRIANKPDFDITTGRVRDARARPDRNVQLGQPRQPGTSTCSTRPATPNSSAPRLPKPTPLSESRSTASCRTTCWTTCPWCRSATPRS